MACSHAYLASTSKLLCMYAFEMTILWLKYPYTVMVLGHSESRNKETILW